MEELDLKEIFNLFWNKKIQIILVVAIFMAIGVIYTLGFVTPIYKSSTTLVLARTENKTDGTAGDTGITTSDVTLNSKLVSTYSELVKSKKVLRAVISNLGMKLDEAKLRKNVTVTSVKDTEFIEIGVTDEDPAVAAKVANEIAKVFIENVKDIYNLNNVHVVDEAETADNPSNIQHTRDVIIFAFIGVVVSVVYVLLLNMLDTTIKSAEDVEKLLDIPVLASVPIYDFEGKSEKGGKRIK
ncbi:MAG: hypothetical protein IKF38_03395 [Clostridia bacterium]|nr:hypothetical protein [Clostridia bacterium]